MKSGLTGARRKPSKASWSGFEKRKGDRKQKRERENVREEGRQKEKQRTREKIQVIVAHLRKIPEEGRGSRFCESNRLSQETGETHSHSQMGMGNGEDALYTKY